MTIPVRIALLEKCRQHAVAHQNMLRQELTKDYMQYDTRRTADARSGNTCQSGGEAQGFNNFLKRHTYQITTQVYDLNFLQTANNRKRNDPAAIPGGKAAIREKFYNYVDFSNIFVYNESSRSGGWKERDQ